MMDANVVICFMDTMKKRDASNQQAVAPAPAENSG